MPWNIVKGGGSCKADEWAVIGGRDGKHLAGCHPDRESALQQQKALYAQTGGRSEEGPEPTVAYSMPKTLSP
jgi:hypothetical protein